MYVTFVDRKRGCDVISRGSDRPDWTNVKFEYSPATWTAEPGLTSKAVGAFAELMMKVEQSW